MRRYPGIIDFIATGSNSGGINIMSYDLSDNMTFYQCPLDGICSLDQQDSFFIDTYLDVRRLCVTKLDRSSN